MGLALGKTYQADSSVAKEPCVLVPLEIGIVKPKYLELASPIDLWPKNHFALVASVEFHIFNN